MSPVKQGVVRTYDPRSRIGVLVTQPDQDEVIVRDESLEGSVFRNLRQGQRVVFETIEEDGVVFARNVRIGHEGY